MYKDVYVTGDTHGVFAKIYDLIQYLKEPSVIIITGDFGGVWMADEKYVPHFYPIVTDEDRQAEEEKLNNLSETLDEHILMFVCGNHENFDRLYSYPETEMFGGLTHEIRPNIFHMMRGEVFNIADMKIFAFGGAFSHDIDGGIIDFTKESFSRDILRAIENNLPYRYKNISWWEEERPSKEELDKGYEVLNNNPYFDYVITHQTNMNIERKMDIVYDGKFGYEFPDFLRAIDVLCDFKCWLFGHYHTDRQLDEKHRCIYNSFVRLTKEGIKDVY